MTRQCVGLLDLTLQAEKLKQGDICSVCQCTDNSWKVSGETPISGIAISNYQLHLVLP